MITHKKLFPPQSQDNRIPFPSSNHCRSPAVSHQVDYFFFFGTSFLTFKSFLTFFEECFLSLFEESFLSFFEPAVGFSSTVLFSFGEETASGPSLFWDGSKKPVELSKDKATARISSSVGLKSKFLWEKNLSFFERNFNINF